MRKATPLGSVLAKTLIALFALEIAAVVIHRVQERRPMVSPPAQVGEWRRVPTGRPISDAQRDYPRQISVQYLNGEQEPIHVDLAMVESLNALRAPQHYLVDGDGPEVQSEVNILKYDNKDAFNLSVLQGQDQDLVSVHWFQTPGGDPKPNRDGLGNAAAGAIALRRPLYSCDAWLQIHGQIDGPKMRALMQKFANMIADSIKISS